MPKASAPHQRRCRRAPSGHEAGPALRRRWLRRARRAGGVRPTFNGERNSSRTADAPSRDRLESAARLRPFRTEPSDDPTELLMTAARLPSWQRLAAFAAELF